MRRSQIFSVLAAVLLSPVSALADDPISDAPEVQAPESAAVPAAPASGADDLQWDQFDDPEFDPTSQTNSAATTAESATGSEASETVVATQQSAPQGIELDGDSSVEVSGGVVLGPQGVDDQGRTGRLHTVATGDTLWDLSAAYLGTPWVWPSVWIDNGDIANPHLILPGDRIWITANEMRVVTAAEAESFLEPRVDEGVSAAVEVDPMIMDADLTDEDSVPPLAALDGAEEDLSTLEAFPIAVPGEDTSAMASGRQITVSEREAMGFVSAEQVAGASSIVDSINERKFLAAGDQVVLGLGEGDVEVGDHFTVFEVVEDVHDVDSNRLLGHHVNVLGWVEVKELTGDTSLAEIRMSYDMIERGTRVTPRPTPSRHVTARPTPDAIEGQIVFLPTERTVMADGGYVYLNRGEFHGVEVGSELEVYEPGAVLTDKARDVDVRTPDQSVAKLVVVTLEEDSSVAFVLSAKRELVVGDDVRPVTSRIARR